MYHNWADYVLSLGNSSQQPFDHTSGMTVSLEKNSENRKANSEFGLEPLQKQISNNSSIKNTRECDKA